MRTRIARSAFGGITALVVVAMILQIPITADRGEPFFTTPVSRVVNLFFYFTIVSNLLVAGVSARLALNPKPLSRGMASVHLASLVNIVITGVVYHVMLAADNEPEGIGVFTDLVFHTAIPILAVAAWLILGPRGTIDPRVVVWSTLVPITWLVVALVRGAVIEWYPYPFIDVLDIGYGGTAAYVAGITAIYLALAFGAMGIDRVLAPRQETRSS